MLRRLTLAGAAVGVLGLVAFWLVTMPERLPADALGTYAPDLANGRTMFFAGGCASCHATPNQEDRTRLGGGLALKTPFGTFYAPNISPHPDDGIGRWSEADFVSAMWKGVAPDGRHYYPAFPYTSYQYMKLEDVRDLFAFLRTLPPVPGQARDHDLAFPISVRRLVGGWKLLFARGAPWQDDPAQSPQWNRGAYLVNGPGHCAECHSPRNALGAIQAEQRFGGGPTPEGEGWAPNITPKRLGAWTEAELAYFLETGETPDGDAVGGSMAAVVRNTAQLSAADRAAMAAYLKSLAPVEGPKPPPRRPSP